MPVKLLLAAVVLAALMGAVLRVAKSQAEQPQAKAIADGEKKSDKDAYLEMRGFVLKATRADLRVPAGRTRLEPFSALMEIGYPNGIVVTVVSGVDGSVSLYTSNGGSRISGTDPIKNAARAFVSLTAKLQSECKPTKEFPLPKSGEATFYLLTDEGAFTTGAKTDAIADEKHPLYPYFRAGHEVITQYRLRDEKQ